MESFEYDQDDEIITGLYLTTGKYLLDVSEWAGASGSYTLQVIAE